MALATYGEFQMSAPVRATLDDSGRYVEGPSDLAFLRGSTNDELDNVIANIGNALEDVSIASFVGQMDPREAKTALFNLEGMLASAIKVRAERS